MFSLTKFLNGTLFISIDNNYYELLFIASLSSIGLLLSLLETIETEIVPVSSGDESVDDEFLSLSTERKRKLGPKMKAKMKEIFEGYRLAHQAPACPYNN